MGKVLSSLTRQVKMFNIEERAYKVISKDKPVPAPLHPKTIQEIEQMIRENPNAISEQQKKDENLDLHLRDVYVLSHDPPTKPKTELVTTDKKRSLPQLRQSSFELGYGYVEPEESVIPPGKFTLKQALQFLSDHQAQPDVFTAEAIAKQYKINQKLAENMVKYYSMFALHIPKEKGSEVILKKSKENYESMTSGNPPRITKEQEEKLKIEELNNKNGKVT